MVSNALVRTPHRPPVLSRRSLASAIKQDARGIAAHAVDCLLLELETYPKPGLVSHVDAGSHTDMDAGTLRRGATALGPYLCALTEAGAQDCDMGRLRVIGIEAEAAMLEATGGINNSSRRNLRVGSALCRSRREMERHRRDHCSALVDRGPTVGEGKS